jgi:hypothetical protein
MGLRTGRRHIGEWESTLGKMRKFGTIVQWSCSTCNRYGRVDLAPLIEALGEDESLWDRRPPCKQPGCTGRVIFMASPSEGTPFRPQLTQGRAQRPGKRL